MPDASIRGLLQETAESYRKKQDCTLQNCFPLSDFLCKKLIPEDPELYIRLYRMTSFFCLPSVKRSKRASKR